MLGGYYYLLSRKTWISILFVINPIVKKDKLLPTLTGPGVDRARERGDRRMAEAAKLPRRWSQRVPAFGKKGRGPGRRARGRWHASPGSRRRGSETTRVAARSPPGWRAHSPHLWRSPAAAPTGPLAVRLLGSCSPRSTCGGPCAPGSAPALLHSAGCVATAAAAAARRGQAGGGWATRGRAVAFGRCPPRPTPYVN